MQVIELGMFISDNLEYFAYRVMFFSLKGRVVSSNEIAKQI